MIIFLYGEDDFRSSEKLKEIKEKFIRSDSEGAGLSVLDLSEKPEADVLSAFGSLGLFSQKRLVIVKNLILSGAKENQEEVQKYLKKNKNIASSNDLVVVFWEENAPRKNNALFKFLYSKVEKVKAQSFEKITGKKLEQWILKKIAGREKEIKISSWALGKLIAYAGNETRILENEIKKLVDFCSPGMINEEAVELLVKSNLDGNIFATIDAMAENNKSKAATLLQNHLEKGEEPFYLFSMFVYQFRNLLKVADFKEKNISNEYEIAKLTKMHPFVVKKSLAQLRNFSLSKLKIIYAELADLDQKIKTGKIDIKLALQKFIIEL
jgi:DNA polymerase III subunit delta